MKILVVDDDMDIREILMFTIETELEAELIEATSGQEAIETLKKTQDIDLILCDYNMPEGNGGLVYTYLLNTETNIPFVFCSSEYAKEHVEFEDRKFLLGEITKPHIFEGIQNIIGAYESYHSQANKASLARTSKEFCEAAIALIANSKTLPCDVYIQVGDKPIKAFNKGASFTAADIAKYEEKKLKSLLIKREDAKLFIDNISKNIIDILEDSSRSDRDKVVNVHDLVMQAVGQLGISESVIKAAARSVEYTLKYFQNNEELGEFQKLLFSSDTSNYLTAHSMGIGYIAIAILRQDSAWDSSANRDKLIMAGFLHDMAIGSNNVVESIFDENNQLSNHQDHPTATVEILKNLPDIPEDVFKIISEHHERPDGSGFPRGLSANSLSPLSTVFIFSHDVVDAVMKLKSEAKEVNLDSVLEILDVELYREGKFRKCLDYLKESKLF